MSEEDKFKVVTTDGTLVFKGSDKLDTGLDRARADSDCEARNKRAGAIGIKTRYEVVPFGGAS